MKIGIDARLIRETGVGRYIRNLLDNLAYVDDRNEYVIFLRKNDFSDFTLPNDRWQKRLADARWHSIAEQWVMPGLFRKERLDLVHIPYFNVPLFYFGAFVVTIHDLTILAMDTGKASTLPGWLYAIKRVAYRLVLTSALHRSRHILTVSKTVKHDILRTFHIPESRISVTYEGIDSMLLETKAHKSETLELPKKYFLYVGNVYPHKNIEVLLDAFKKFKSQTQEDIYLVFIGPEDFFYQKLKLVIASLEMQQSVLFFHGVHDEDLLRAYSGAIALLFPSRMEGFGLPALEALSSGCRVIASDIPIFHEILQSHAKYSDSTSSESLSRTMNEVHKEFFDKKSFQKTLVPYLSQFSWRTMTMQTLQMYTASQHS